MNYNLSVLNDKEFEDLSKDLLEIVLKSRLQNFKKGKDGGIDLRFSGNKNNEIIIQAKHYINSKFSDLKHKLIKSEKPNIEKLIPLPGRYILTTSLGLNPSDVDTILNEMRPYIKSADDIFGKDQIESLLSMNAKIEEKFYKLWITSTTVLQRILHNGTKGRSEFYKEKILRKVGLYVQTINFENALEKLTENNFLIISGEPGVGKTTIAYLLICNLLANDYELIHIDDSLRVAGDMISSDPEKKQIFFFDDFLGSNIYELTNPRNTESAIVSFIDRIKVLKNKYLILTTRTTILNQANYMYEKFRREKFTIISKYELKISDYSIFNKAEILYNHLYQSDMGEGLYEALFSEKNYLKVINHKNYSPRLIEFITESLNFKNSTLSSLKDFIFYNLDNPQEIWRDAYEKQLGDIDRFLLTTLFSLSGYNISSNRLENAFNCRYNYEIATNGFQLEHNAFNISLKKLLDGFIKSVKDIDTGLNYFSFINPSIGDFLLNYLRENQPERWRILNGIKYTVQLNSLFHPNKKDKLGITNKEQSQFYPIFKNNSKQLLPKEHEILSIDLCYIYFVYFEKQVEEEIIIDYLNLILSQQSAHNQFAELSVIVDKSFKMPVSQKIIVTNWHQFINMLYSGTRDLEDFQKISKVFKLYNESLSNYLENSYNKDVVKESIKFCFDEIKKDIEFSSDAERLVDRFHEFSKEYAAQLISEKFLEIYVEFINNCGLSDFYDFFNIDLDFNEDEILDEILKNYTYENDDSDRFMETRKDLEPTENINFKIDRLFER